jgi:hypothetical protein
MLTAIFRNLAHPSLLPLDTWEKGTEKGDATLFLDADGTTERKRVASPLFLALRMI